MHRARVCIQAGLEGGLLDEAIAEAQTMMALDDHLTLAARDLIVRVHLLRRDVAAASTELARLPLPATRAMLESLRGNAGAARTLLRSINTRWVDPSEVGEAYAWTGDFESATEAWEEALRQGTLDFAASVHSPFVGPQFWSDEWGADFLYRHFRQPEQLQTLHLPLHLPVQDGSGLTQADRESLMCERVQRVQAVMSLDHPLAVRHVAELMLELGSAGEAAAWLRDHAPTMVNDMDWNLAMAHVLLHMGPEHADEALHRANASISLARVLGNRLSSRVATQLRGESNTTFKVRELAQARALRRVSYIDEGSIELRCRAMLLRGNAVDLVREVAALQDRYIWASTTLAMCLQAAGRTQEAAQAMEDAIAEGDQDNAAGIAEAFAMMGAADRFFEWVDIAMKTDYQGLLRLAIAGSPFVPDSIAQSRRWHAVLERLNRSPAQLSAVQFSTARPVMPSEVFHSHLAGGRLEDAARMIRAGEFGEASADRAVTLLIQSLDEAQLERALQLQLQGEGRPFAERIEFALSMIDEGLLGDRTSRAYVTVLRRLEDSATGNEMLPELTRPERLAQYGMTRQDIAALEIASQFH
jgi:tetratricopeptide (TPR) repeat protein